MEEKSPKNLKLKRDRIHKLNKQCIFCNKNFRKVTKFIGHLRLHINEKPFFCEFCGSSFNKRSGLKLHEESYEGGRGQCSVIKEDLQIRRLKQRTCPICHKIFSTSANCNRHQLIHSADDPSKEICIFCKKPFTDAWNLHRHILTDIEERAFFCKICGTEFVQKASLKRHRAKFKGKCVEMMGEKEKMRRRRIRKLVSKLAKIICDQLKSQGRHQPHQESGPSQPLPFLCSICDTTFHNQSELNEHKNNHFETTTDNLDLDDNGSCIDLSHDDDDPGKKKKKKRHKKVKFKCAFCPARFRGMELLEKHFTEVHKGNVTVDDDEDENLENKGALKSTAEK